MSTMAQHRPRQSSATAMAVNAAIRPARDRRGHVRHGVAATSAQEISELARRMAVLCESAVDAWEITAGLEAEGINDKIARRLYGLPDVFSLADVLYRRVPRRPLAGGTVVNPWRGTAGRHLLRGVLFGIPGVCYVAAAQSLAGRGAVLTIVLSLVLSWAASEALAFLGYSRLGQLDVAGSARLLRRGLAVALLVLIPATVAAGWALHAGAPAVAFAAGQSVYLVAATVVLIGGGERWLLAALAPGVAASAGFLALGRAGTPVWVWAASVATVLATVVLAVALTRRRDGAPARPIRLADLRSALPHAGFGLLAGGLLTFATLSAVLGGNHAAGIAVLPISLTMGAAEWLLFRFRRRTHALLNTRASIEAFSRSARVALIGAVAGYLMVLVLAAGLVVLIGGYTISPWPVLASISLGGALFLALMLRSCGVNGVVLGGFALTLGAEAAIRWLPFDVLRQLPAGLTGEFAVCGVLFAVLLAYAIAELGRATRHR